MTALRATRQAMSERPVLPPGASCSVDANGVATVLDPGRGASSCSPRRAPARPQRALAPSRRSPRQRMLPGRPPASPTRGAHARFNTVSFGAGSRRDPPVEVRIEPSAPTVAAPTPHTHAVENPTRPVITTPSADTAASAIEREPHRRRSSAFPAAAAATKKKFQTVAFTEGFPTQRATREAPVGRASPLQPACRPHRSRRAARDRRSSSMLLERDEDPTPGKPALLPRARLSAAAGHDRSGGRSRAALEARRPAEGTRGPPRGKLVNLAVFDHRWRTRPNGRR